MLVNAQNLDYCEEFGKHRRQQNQPVPRPARAWPVQPFSLWKPTPVDIHGQPFGERLLGTSSGCHGWPARFLTSRVLVWVDKDGDLYREALPIDGKCRQVLLVRWDEAANWCSKFVLPERRIDALFACWRSPNYLILLYREYERQGRDFPHGTLYVGYDAAGQKCVIPRPKTDWKEPGSSVEEREPTFEEVLAILTAMEDESADKLDEELTGLENDNVDLSFTDDDNPAEPGDFPGDAVTNAGSEPEPVPQPEPGGVHQGAGGSA